MTNNNTTYSTKKHKKEGHDDEQYERRQHQCDDNKKTSSPLKGSGNHQYAVLLAISNIILTSIVIHFHYRYFSFSSLPAHPNRDHGEQLILQDIVMKQQQQGIDTTAPFQDAVPYGPLGLRGISHVCINVPDVDEAAEFYHRVLGYEIMKAGEKWGNFDLRNLDTEEFCKSAGFMDGKCRLDCLWMKHPSININLELFHYYEPYVVNRLEEQQQRGEEKLASWLLSNTQDIGGIKHISYAVQNASQAFEFLKTQEGVHFISDDPNYQPVRMAPFPFKFFYWVDPYGVQWECEEGDESVTHQIAGVTRNVDKYIEFKEKKKGGNKTL
mmetsp:Transcript_16788/g.31815  ORF Transcript_16788/g.31815 Transcript_16788/m.31815 type:complete len:326 (-) Transcript_16788:95-1072(-)|eukprot:CAMPEP_0176492182 /NCGR_PEP_ID=MMETSP0200_2-20121128/8847_1 /TAXON_ID=947934 /ORGANISM="Chaetoceros sp., Strain GSL56" /LENGTH=325 /DNA_ID=CAMNT_0017889697 /DNA_START=100 /DNA_END=1077 /DNA_ORIENTATION=-